MTYILQSISSVIVIAFFLTMLYMLYFFWKEYSKLKLQLGGIETGAKIIVVLNVMLEKKGTLNENQIKESYKYLEDYENIIGKHLVAHVRDAIGGDK